MAAGDFLQFFILCAVTFAAWAIAYFYPDETLSRIAFTLLVVTILYFVLRIALERGVLRTIKDAKMRYSFRKAVSVFYIVAVAAVAVRIWIDDPQSLLVAYGIIAAGIAISLQDFFKNFVGSIVIFLGAAYTVGDRIAIGKTAGDVIDIGLMSTTLMEIRGWVSGDQPSGRLLTIPNGLVINHPLYNYTRDHSFVWDEISIPLTYDSDWRRANDLILGIVVEETAAMTVQADAEIERIGETYYLPKKVVEPSAYITLTDNWITLDIRYVADARNRRVLRSRLNELALAAIEEEDQITIASTTVTVTNVAEPVPTPEKTETGEMR